MDECVRMDRGVTITNRDRMCECAYMSVCVCVFVIPRRIVGLRWKSKTATSPPHPSSPISCIASSYIIARFGCGGFVVIYLFYSELKQSRVFNAYMNIAKQHILNTPTTLKSIKFFEAANR